MPNYKNNSQDNRKTTRYMVRDSSAVMLMPGNIISYCVLNICKSGLAFCYYGQTSISEMSKNTLATLFADTAGAINIPIEVICDTELNEKLLSYESETDRSKKPYLRRCGIKFASLSQHHEDKLNTYIQNHMTN